MATVSTPMLQVNSLQVKYKVDHGWLTGLDKVSLIHKRQKNLGIIGESGSGKTTLALSLLGLINPPHEVTGKIVYEGTDLLTLSRNEIKELRWKTISMVFQNSLEILNPVMKIGQQITEPLVETSGISKREAEQEQGRLLELVGLEQHWKDAYPHQLSGGMRQRVLIAMAVSCSPNLIILDEPTSSLDAILRKNTIKLIKNLQQKLNFSMIVISHDLSIMAELTDTLSVMYAGAIVENGSVKEVLNEAQHPYTRGLINSSVEVFPYKDMWGIPGEAATANSLYGCSFAPRCTQHTDICSKSKPELKQIKINRDIACHRGGIVNLLEAVNIAKRFLVKDKTIAAVNDVSFYIRHGETAALVGKSGSGKSTIAQIIAGFMLSENGTIIFDQKQITDNRAAKIEKGIQLVLQDPFSSLSHRLTVEQAIEEPLEINKIGSTQERLARIKRALHDVQLPYSDEFLKRYCTSLSGGQRQRVAVARALVMKPKLLIADEITSMLDVSTQANMMRLLKGLQNSQGFAMLYITHDLHLARKISERIIILYQGEITETGSVSQIVEESCCHHTRELIEAGL